MLAYLDEAAQKTAPQLFECAEQNQAAAAAPAETGKLVKNGKKSQKKSQKKFQKKSQKKQKKKKKKKKGNSN